MRRRIVQVHRSLRAAYPDAGCELKHWKTPLELAVAAILSAQSTDVLVNKVTPALFAKYRTAADWAAVPQAQLEKEVYSTGFFRNKARNIRALGAALVERFAGQVPQDIETLITLPGIGRKTANLLLISAFNQPGIVVDTHFGRLARRLGFTKATNPDKVEREIKALLPESEWAAFSHELVIHGRRCCYARKPNCAGCPVKGLCPSAGLFT